MITIISGTNRKNSKTKIVAESYLELFKKATDEEVNFLPLCEVSNDMLKDGMYQADGQSEDVARLQDEMILPAQKFFIVSPEYNGGIPGILKLFIDAISVREYKSTFKNKKVGLAGVASGRAGNLRGMDQLTGVFNHVGSIVMPNMLPISGVGGLTNHERVTDEGTLNAMQQQVEEFVAF
ncbi:MAG: NADPH-dependent FMN reductase [Saprospiraceae bacterium]